jgi:Uncharacterized protein conserved in bacteria (DUF2188)
MARKNQYVIRHPEGWAVKGEGNSRATRIFIRQWEAIDFGSIVAMNQRSILIICNRKGVERDRKDYRNYQPYSYTPSYNWSSYLYPPQPLNSASIEPSTSITAPTEAIDTEELIVPEGFGSVAKVMAHWNDE